MANATYEGVNSQARVGKRRAALEPKKLTADEWHEVSRNKTIQFAVLEQIRDNCKELGGLKR